MVKLNSNVNGISADSIQSGGNSRQTHKRNYSDFLPKEEAEWFRPFVLFIAVFQVMTFFVLGVFAVGLWRVAMRPVPTLVQTRQGEALAVTPAGPLYRDPEVIKNFASEMTSLLFSWSGTVVSSDALGNRITQQDTGVSVAEQGHQNQGQDKVPTSVWSASFALAESFRLPFLRGLAQLIPESVWNSQGNTAVKFRSLGEPEQLELGKWRIAVVADLLIFDYNNPAGRAVPLNKMLYLQAVPNPPLPLGDEATPIQQTVYHSRLAQLEVYQIEDLKDSPE